MLGGVWVESTGGGTDLSAAAILAPVTSGRNVVQPTDAAVTPLTLRGQTGQTADILRIEDSLLNLLGEVTASGQLSVGAELVTAGYSAGHATAQFHDIGVSDPDEPVVEVFHRNKRGGVSFYNVEDNYDGYYPWFWMLGEYDAGEHLGQDSLVFWYGLHTPDEEPASAQVGFQRNGDSAGWLFGAQADTYDDAVTNDLEYFFISEGAGSTNVPFRLYPNFRLVLALAEPDDALLANGDLGVWVTDTEVKFKTRTSGGTIKTGAVAVS